MKLEFDLLGDPIPKNHGERGRNEYTPNQEELKKISNLTMAGASVREMAEEIGVSIPTFRKHFFHNREIKTIRRTMLIRARAKEIGNLREMAAEGNAAAAGKLIAIYEKEMLRDDSSKFVLPKQKAEYVSKKEASKANARTAASTHTYLPDYGVSN